MYMRYRRLLTCIAVDIAVIWSLGSVATISSFEMSPPFASVLVGASDAFIYEPIEIDKNFTVKDINNRGQIVGKMNGLAVLWQDGLFTTIGPHNAEAINDLGEIAGHTSHSSTETSLWVYSLEGGKFIIVRDPRQRTIYYPEDINDNHTIVGAYYNLSSLSYHAFRVTGKDEDNDGFAEKWFEDKKPEPNGDFINDYFVDLGTLGGNVSWANAVNGNDVVTGFAAVLQGSGHAFRSGGDTGMEDLGTFADGKQSTGYGINDSNQVIGQGTGPWQNSHSFITNNIFGGLNDLGLLGKGTDTRAYAINNRSQVVGTAGTSGAWAYHAFIWDATNGLRDLNQYLTNSADWEIRDAVAINDAGVVVGHGSHLGLSTSIILKPIDQTQCPAPTGNITTPFEDETIGPSTLFIQAEVPAVKPCLIKQVEFSVYYNGQLHRAGIDEIAPYNIHWQMSNSLPSQKIQVGITITDIYQSKTNFAGGLRTINYIESLGNPTIQENWVPFRVYLNQSSLTPNGEKKCAASSMAMMLAMESKIGFEYPTLRDNANDMDGRIRSRVDGTAWIGLMVKELEQQGLKAKWQELNTTDAWNAIRNSIDSGHPVIIRTTHNAVTASGHYFVAVGYSENEQHDRKVIVYDPYGAWNGTCCTRQYDINSTDPASAKGRWRFYDFDRAFGPVNYIIVTSGQNSSAQSLMAPVTAPDLISNEPEDWRTYNGVPESDNLLFLPTITR